MSYKQALKNHRNKRKNYMVSMQQSESVGVGSIKKFKKRKQESLDYLLGTGSEGYRYAIRETEHVKDKKKELKQQKNGILNLEVGKYNSEQDFRRMNEFIKEKQVKI